MPTRAPDVNLPRMDERTAGNAARTAAKAAFTRQGLWHLAAWGAMAAIALLVAILATGDNVASQRAANVLASHLAPPPAGVQATPQVASQPAKAAPPSNFDLVSATRQLTQAVRGLTEDRDQLAARLAAVEHNLDDITGAINRQAETAKATLPPWPDEPPAVVLTTPGTPAIMAATLTAATPLSADPTSLSSSPPSPSPPPSSPPSSADVGAQTPAAPTLEFGVDLGSGLSMDALRARWAKIRSAHPQLFDGFVAVVATGKMMRVNQPELRLIVGPIPNARAAAKLCASVARRRLSCRPTLFSGQHLALE